MNIFQTKFSTGQTVAAAGVTNAVLQSWLKRDGIVGHKGKAGIEGGSSPGVYRQFTFFNVMEIATAKALVDAGFDLRAAFRAAAAFAHTGDDGRDPGLPFPANHTLLFASLHHVEIVEWEPGRDMMALVRSRFSSPLGVMVLEMRPIFTHAVTALGFDPAEVLQFSKKA